MLRMISATRPVGIVGVGYEGLLVGDLIAYLRKHEFDVLVDVRLNAVSRKTGYSKRALATALWDAGIDYIHDPRLGNQKDNRAGYKEIGTVTGDEARERFRRGLNDRAVRDLSMLARDHFVAVLCFEADERHCHREQVIAAVREASSIHD